MPVRAAALAVLVLLAAGCGGSRSISAHDVSSLVLQGQDLAGTFARFSSGPVTHLDTAGTARSNPFRFDHRAGWIARYHRTTAGPAGGALVIESRVDVFGSDGGAKEDLLAYRRTFAQTPGAKRRWLSQPGIGDAAVGQTFVQEAGKPIRFYEIAWRERNATASVTVEGFEGAVTARDAIRLARRQEQRLDGA